MKRTITTLFAAGIINNIAGIVLITPNDSVCVNGEVKISIVAGAQKHATAYNLNWGDGTISNDTSNLIHTYSDPGIYTASLSDGSNNTTTETIRITVLNTMPRFPYDTSFCTNERTVISAENPGAQYSWSTGQQTQKIQIEKPGAYTVDISYSGCTISKTINVWKIQDDNFVSIPTAFTPNMDGKNDDFKVIASDPVEDFHLHIFSKGGELMFQTRDINAAWDGTFKDGGRVPNDIYVVLTEYKTQCGQRIVPHTSNLMVMR
jgi:gliding motility-associated-like protein